MVSVIVFAAVQLFGQNLDLQFFGEREVHVLRSARPMGEASQGAWLVPSPVRIVQDHVDLTAVRRFAALSPEERFSLLRARRAPDVLHFVLFLVQVFAVALGPFYRRQRRPFVDHLVFGLHGQALLLLVLLVSSALPAIVANALSLWVIGYFMIALRRVYGGRWPASIWRGAVILSDSLSTHKARRSLRSARSSSGGDPAGWPIGP